MNHGLVAKSAKPTFFCKCRQISLRLSVCAVTPPFCPATVMCSPASCSYHCITLSACFVSQDSPASRQRSDPADEAGGLQEERSPHPGLVQLGAHECGQHRCIPEQVVGLGPDAGGHSLCHHSDTDLPAAHRARYP